MGKANIQTIDLGKGLVIQMTKEIACVGVCVCVQRERDPKIDKKNQANCKMKEDMNSLPTEKEI